MLQIVFIIALRVLIEYPRSESVKFLTHDVSTSQAYIPSNVYSIALLLVNTFVRVF